MNFNQLGELLRKKFPELHDQPNFSEGKDIWVLKVVRLRDKKGDIDPEYKLSPAVFCAPKSRRSA